MRVSFEWIKDFIDISATTEEVADTLTMIGLEVEGTEYVHGDTVFEINITPNRPDCLSILGISRELSAAFNIPIKIPKHEIARHQAISDYSIEILNPELCNRYTGRLIKNITISESPDWIKKRLEKGGIRTINNIVDITNYVLLEFGHPLHAFDADKIIDKKIIIGTAKVGDKIVTLDGIERILPEGVLLIFDNVKPIAIAGVMGGRDTEVTEKTKNIFLESAYFEPLSIRKTSRLLNLKSESSYRFERGTDILFLENALNRAAFLIQEIAGGTVYRIIDEYPVKYLSEPVLVDYKKVNRLLGTEIQKAEMLEILKRLGMKIEERGDVFLVYPASYRRDIQRESDVSEEIARIYGYNRIPTTLPKTTLSTAKLDNKRVHINKIRDSIRRAGFTEVINYSFANMNKLNMLFIPESDIRRQVITLSNPLNQEDCLLRTTLIPALIDNLKFNLDRGIKDLKIFEIANVFINKGNMLPSEELMLGGIFYREKVPILWKDDTHNYFIVKGAIESLFLELKISGYKFISCSQAFLHHGKSADIFISDMQIGYLGILRPEIIEELDLKKQKPEIVVFEINIDNLMHFIPKGLKFNPIPKYPPVERDISIVVNDTIPSSNIMEIIESFPSDLIEEVSLFDYYKGANIPLDKKSLAFNIIYRSQEKTLTDEEVEKIHTALIKYIINKTGGELRK
ncbi:MAG: phenylalanine--tRNA ligase subunit beta [Nitrospirae bacterium]|nr:phenylalanine--tRNA ligase subunit beta [Nitrospirota bacterium]